MKKAKVLIAAGVMAGLSALPIAASYADTTGSGNATVKATVGSYITVSASGGTISGNIMPGESGTTNVNVRVKTNTTKGFSVTVTGGSLNSSGVGGHSIAASTSAAAGTEGWYIKDYNETAIAPSATEQTFWSYTSSTGSAIDQNRNFQVFVGTSESTPDGTYQGTLTFTATATVE